MRGVLGRLLLRSFEVSKTKLKAGQLRTVQRTACLVVTSLVAQRAVMDLLRLVLVLPTDSPCLWTAWLVAVNGWSHTFRDDVLHVHRDDAHHVDHLKGPDASLVKAQRLDLTTGSERRGTGMGAREAKVLEVLARALPLVKVDDP